jgi:hypothetical protein
MNFTPVLDESLICQIASTHHENTEFDHFTHGGNLESVEVRVAGLFGRDQVNLRTARPEMMQDSVQLDLLDTVGCDDGDLPAGMEFGIVGRSTARYPGSRCFPARRAFAHWTAWAPKPMPRR